MARRRYKSAAVSNAGHQERPPNPAPDESFAQPIEPKQEYGKADPDPAPEPAQHYDASGLKAQIEQQRQQQQSDQLDAYLTYAFPGATPNERRWLRANVHHLQNPMLVHQAALRRASSFVNNLAADRRPVSKRLTWCSSYQAPKVWT